jgi:transcription-repair coupling factor (superfamily II helicase)
LCDNYAFFSGNNAMSQPKLLLPGTARALKRPTYSEWGQSYGCAPALLVAEHWAQKQSPVLVVTSSVLEAEALEAQLHFFCQDSCRIGLLPDPETLPYDSFSPHADLISRRLSVLGE